jgi:UrcA family protein
MTRFTKAAFLSMAAYALSVPFMVNAQELIVVEGGRPTVYVSFADLNISRDAGIQTLNMRVRGAARQLCVEDGVRPIKEQYQSRMCFNDAIENANAQIENAVANYNGNRLSSRNAIAVVASR